jgi:hypothetical protein
MPALIAASNPARSTPVLVEMKNDTIYLIAQRPDARN